MKRLMFCGLVLILMYALLPYTTCLGYDVPILKINFASEIRDVAFVPTVEKKFSSQVNLQAIALKSYINHNGCANKFNAKTAYQKRDTRSRLSASAFVAGFA